MPAHDAARQTWETSPVPRAGHRIWSARRPGSGPTVVLMHGFPDNHHLYDEVVDHLPGHDLLLFDFLGSGDSDRPPAYSYTFDALQGDLEAVLAHHGVDRVLLVPHDISGPPAIAWAATHPEQVAGMVLLNTYFGPSPTMTPPEIIRALTARTGRTVQRAFRAVAFSRPVFRPAYDLQLRRMIGDRATSDRVLDDLFAPFAAEPSQRHAFTALADDMHRATAAQAALFPAVRTAPFPVVVAFGDEDYSLDVGVAAHLLALFPHAVDAPVRGARHFPQLTHPRAVAERVRQAIALAG